MKEIISTNSAPEAVGPYSQAIKYNGMLYLSGQVSVNPNNGEIEKGNIEDQTRRVFNNIENVLEVGGSSLDKVIKCNVYLTSMSNFDGMNKIYSKFFPENSPARITVAVQELYGGLDIEVDVIAGID